MKNYSCLPRSGVGIEYSSLFTVNRLNVINNFQFSLYYRSVMFTEKNYLSLYILKYLLFAQSVREMSLTTVKMNQQSSVCKTLAGF